MIDAAHKPERTRTFFDTSFLTERFRAEERAQADRQREVVLQTQRETLIREARLQRWSLLGRSIGALLAIALFMLVSITAALTVGAAPEENTRDLWSIILSIYTGSLGCVIAVKALRTWLRYQEARSSVSFAGSPPFRAP